MTLIIFKWWSKKWLLLLSGLHHNTYWFPIQTFIPLHCLNLCIQWLKYRYWFPIQTFISLHRLNLSLRDSNIVNYKHVPQTYNFWCICPIHDGFFLSASFQSITPLFICYLHDSTYQKRRCPLHDCEILICLIANFFVCSKLP